MGNLTKEQKKQLAEKISKEVVLILKIKSVLESHPKGLKARDIADLIAGVDKKEINHILYSYSDTFAVKDFVWTLQKENSKPYAVNKSIEKKETKSDLFDDFIIVFEELYGKKDYISKEAKQSITRLDDADYNLFISQLKQLNCAPIPKAKPGYSIHTEIDACITLALLPENDFKEKMIRSQKILSVNANLSNDFTVWNSLVTQPPEKFQKLLQAANKIKGISIIPGIDNCTNWHKLIVNLSKKSGYKKFLERNEDINNSYAFKQELENYYLWETVAFMSQSEYKNFRSNISDWIRFQGTTPLMFSVESEDVIKLCSHSKFEFEHYCSKLRELSSLIRNNKISFEWLRDNFKKYSSLKYINFSAYTFVVFEFDKLETLSIKYKEYQKEQMLLQKSKESVLIEKAKSQSIRNNTWYPLEIGRACTGDCSTCKREECVENKK